MHVGYVLNRENRVLHRLQHTGAEELAKGWKGLIRFGIIVLLVTRRGKLHTDRSDGLRRDIMSRFGRKGHMTLLAGSVRWRHGFLLVYAGALLVFRSRIRRRLFGF